MKLDLLVLADGASASGSGKVDIEGAGVSHVTADTLPFVLPSITVVMRFVMEVGDSPEHRIEVSLTDPEGNAQAAVRGTITPSLPREHKQTHAGEDPMMVVIANLLNITFERQGRYVFTVSLDGQALGELPLVLVLASSST
jgi:Family of unknown function (DUF6941)